MISKFQGETRWLSNFWPARVTYDGEIYPTTEHAYQAAKTLSEGQRFHIRQASTPGQAKRLGMQVTLRSDWEEIKLGVMEDLVRQKFFNDSTLAEKLLATGDEELVEGNLWGDRFWGVCHGVGRNHLGKITMKIRAELFEAKENV